MVYSFWGHFPKYKGSDCYLIWGILQSHSFLIYFEFQCHFLVSMRWQCFELYYSNLNNVHLVYFTRNHCIRNISLTLFKKLRNCCSLDWKRYSISLSKQIVFMVEMDMFTTVLMPQEQSFPLNTRYLHLNYFKDKGVCCLPMNIYESAISFYFSVILSKD